MIFGVFMCHLYLLECKRGVLWSSILSCDKNVLIQVYYLPVPPFYNQCILPSLFTTLPLLRSVFLHEKISIVHGHSVRCKDFFSLFTKEALYLRLVVRVLVVIIIIRCLYFMESQTEAGALLCMGNAVDRKIVLIFPCFLRIPLSV